MKKVLILYFSGAGSTNKVARLMYENLRSTSMPELRTFEGAAILNLNDFDALIIGTPVYHAAPANIVTGYFGGIKRLNKQIPAFLYNTRATWSCNTNRILAKQIKEKNIITIMDKDYRSPASDGSLIAPFVKRFFEFQKDLAEQVHIDCIKFLHLLSSQNPTPYIPRLRLSSLINAPNKLAGQLITFPIYNHRVRCTACSTCTKNCPHSALITDADGYPVWSSKRCENCYRCIHHCPSKALSLSKRRPPKKLLKF